MPSFNIIKTTKPEITYRVSSVLGAFDLQIEHVKENFKGSMDIEGREWNIGLIVGGSGTGKSTIAKEVFKDYYIGGYNYGPKAVVDEMPDDCSIKDIEMAFTTTGFSSPPSWLKPYDVLSNGEKMRVDLARALLENREIIVFDEFTSVVNREVAKTASYALSKAVKKAGKRFVAVSCHRDVIEWLEPDWIYDTDEKSFFMLRESSIAHKSDLKFTGLTTNIKTRFGKYLENIII